MTDKIIEVFRNAGLVNSENDKIILLGVRRIGGALTDLFIAMLWSLIWGDVFVGILFEVCYSVLRIYAGGYHASSERICKYLTYASTLISILIIFKAGIDGYVMHCLVAALVCLIVWNAPVENKNKPLSEKEKKIYKRYCIVISFIEMGLYLIFILINMTVYARTVCIAILLVAIGVIVEKKSSILSRSFQKRLFFI